MESDIERNSWIWYNSAMKSFDLCAEQTEMIYGVPRMKSDVWRHFSTLDADRKVLLAGVEES